jgi:hypothetical protein
MSTTTQQSTAYQTRELYSNYIFVRVFLERCKTVEVLRRMRTKRKNLWSDDAEALLDSIVMMENDAERLVKEALRAGQLLFCFEGTKVLEGGAA